MTIRKLLVLLLGIVSFPVLAGFNSVTVPAAMLHMPDAGTGLGFSGELQYAVTAGDTDSVYVTLTITTADGATTLALSEMSGDVGMIRIVNPNVAENHMIFFQAPTAVPGTQYIAHLTAGAAISGVKTQVEGFLQTMSKNDKAAMMSGCCDGFTGTAGGTTIPAIFMSDGPNGVRPTSGSQASLFPTCSNEASSWDTAIATIDGQAKGEEFRALGKNCSLGPALDLVYHPQGGRASEYYGEDPYESGHMAAADVRGEQLKGVAATIKHYACNNKEDNRQTLSANMSERSLREVYLANWETPIVQGGCWGVMGAYNQVNRLVPNQGPACQNKYLETDVLRNEWGYKYMAMTDWGVIMNFQPAITYGIDIEMPGPNNYTPGAVAQEPDSIVNMHIRRIIYTHEKIGDLVSGYLPTAFGTTFESTVHEKIIRQVGTAGIVLGRNDSVSADSNGNALRVLPLPKKGAKIALTGSFATTCRLGPGGSSLVNPYLRVDPTTGINQLLKGTAGNAGGYPPNPGASTLVADITTADYIVVFVGVTGEQEGADRPYLAVQSGDGDAAVQAALNVKTAKTIVVYTGGSAASTGGGAYWPQANAIVFAFYPGEDQGMQLRMFCSAMSTRAASCP